MLPNDGQAIDVITIHPPISPSQEREEGRLYSFDDVQDRLVEAMLVMRKLSDREAGWLRVKAMWPDIVRERELGDYDARGGDMQAPAPRPLPATRKDIAEMEEAFAWVLAAKERDRRLIALAIGALANGEKRVPWMKLRAAMGVKRGAGGLRMRYERAMRSVVKAANAGLLRVTPCQTV